MQLLKWMFLETPQPVETVADHQRLRKQVREFNCLYIACYHIQVSILGHYNTILHMPFPTLRTESPQWLPSPS